MVSLLRKYYRPNILWVITTLQTHVVIFYRVDAVLIHSTTLRTSRTASHSGLDAHACLEENALLFLVN